MRKHWMYIGLAVLWLMGTAVSASAGDMDLFEEQAGDINISGGTAHIPVMKAAAEAIRRRNPRIRINIAGGGSGVGIKQVGEGLVDIGNSGRQPTDEEVAKYGLVPHKWAMDGVAVVVHPDNAVKALTSAQLKQIYAGRLTNWKALGGADHPIDIYTRDQASGTRAVFWKKALGRGDISPRALFTPSNGAMKTAVAQDPYAIGYVSVGHIDAGVAPVALDGVAPSLENVKIGAYKVARGLYSNTKGEPKGLTQKFIAFLFGPQGRKIIAQQGFIPVD